MRLLETIIHIFTHSHNTRWHSRRLFAPMALTHSPSRPEGYCWNSTGRQIFPPLNGHTYAVQPIQILPSRTFRESPPKNSQQAVESVVVVPGRSYPVNLVECTTRKIAELTRKVLHFSQNPLGVLLISTPFQYASLPIVCVKSRYEPSVRKLIGDSGELTVLIAGSTDANGTMCPGKKADEQLIEQGAWRATHRSD